MTWAGLATLLGETVLGQPWSFSLLSWQTRQFLPHCETTLEEIGAEQLFSKPLWGWTAFGCRSKIKRKPLVILSDCLGKGTGKKNTLGAGETSMIEKGRIATEKKTTGNKQTNQQKQTKKLVGSHRWKQRWMRMRNGFSGSVYYIPLDGPSFLYSHRGKKAAVESTTLIP